MCERNGDNACFGPRSTSSFVRQRKITYVDNPFDEQASMNMMQLCDLKYLNYPRRTDKVASKPTKESSYKLPYALSRGHSELFDEEKKLENAAERVDLLRTFASERAETCCDDTLDWSYLFSPVQCHNNSPSGEIQLSLSYDPRLSTLKVAIIKARGLTCPICSSKSKNSGIICVGTFINISLLSNNKQIQTRRTEMKTKKTEIFFYEKFSFPMEKEAAKNCSLLCRAVHKVGSLIKRNHVIGQVAIGADARCDGDGLRHWKEVLRRPNKNITQWYYLKEG